MPQTKSKHGTQITAEARNGRAIIRIVDTISEYGNSSSEMIRSQIDGFIRDGIKEADVYINSKGGNCFESAEMANELDRLDSVQISVGALAASAATYLLTRFPSKAKPNSQFMLHRPRLGTYGDIVSIMADLKLLENTTADYKAAYAKKMEITEEEVETLWSAGDVWLTAQQALEKKLITEIEAGNETAVTAEDIAILEACGAPVIPEKQTEKLNKPKVERTLLISALGLDADASDEQIEAAVKANKQKADEAATQEATAQEGINAKAEALVKKANLVDKKITAEQVPHFTKLAVADYDSTAAILEAMSPIAKLSAELRTPSKEEQAERKNWSLDDYLEKDPQAYQAMIDHEPERAKRLEAAYFGK